MTNSNSLKALPKQLVGGTMLIVIGGLLLVSQFLQSEMLGALIPGALGIIFLAWAIAARQVGMLIPGGILSGIGAGIYLTQFSPWGDLPEPQRGGLFLLAFAAGWALITLLSLVLFQRKLWWPLIPGTILALIGGATIAGGAALDALALASKAWPVILILIGVTILFRRKEVEEN